MIEFKKNNMREILYTFEPIGSGTQSTFYLAILAALMGLGGMIALLRMKTSREHRNRNMLAAMLLFFVFLIGAGTALFSGLKMRKIGPVYIYADAITTPYGEAEFEHIKDAYIYADREPSLIDPSRSVRTTRMLVVQEESGKSHVLSEEDYPVKEVLAGLRTAIRKWEKEE